MDSRLVLTTVLRHVLVTCACGGLPLLSHAGEPPGISRAASDNGALLQQQRANSISNFRVEIDDNGDVWAQFDAFYTGQPAPVVYVIGTQLLANPNTGDKPTEALTVVFATNQSGSRHLRAKLDSPPGRDPAAHQFVARMSGPGQVAVVEQTVERLIEWRMSRETGRLKASRPRTVEEQLDAAVDDIDSGEVTRIESARSQLEKIVEKDPDFDAAYVELARIVMKTNWGPEGLRQAESLIGSALAIRPESANAKILLGYVYVHQRRFPIADRLFREAAAAKSDNPWLWANWGESLIMQKQTDAAIDKYREALRRPPATNRYTPARQDAYRKLIALLSDRRDFAGTQILLEQRMADYGAGECGNAELADFMLRKRGDSDGAIRRALLALPHDCSTISGREVLGMSYYVLWAASAQNGKSALLNKARVYLPVGSKMLYLLAGSTQTSSALSALAQSGESLDQLDNRQRSALEHAMDKSDSDAIARLLKLGARADIPLSDSGLPAALRPVVEGDGAMVKIFLANGVDYRKLQIGGQTAVELALATGHDDIAQLIGRPGQYLWRCR